LKEIIVVFDPRQWAAWHHLLELISGRVSQTSMAGPGHTTHLFETFSANKFPVEGIQKLLFFGAGVQSVPYFETLSTKMNGWHQKIPCFDCYTGSGNSTALQLR